MRIFRFVKSTLVKQVAIGLVVVAIPLSTVLAFQDTPPANDTSPSADLDNDMVEDEFDDDEFADLDLEDLMEIQVVEISSVAGVEQSLLETPSAVYVLDAEDVRRTGVQSIAEAIRLVPGMDVIQLNASTWAISSRGFNGTYANKLLVMVDGRTVYTPSFAGVFWDTQDVVLEDLDRIEVIRGPGATLWGANAVNGVINIVTKGAKDTQGLYLTAGTGTEERGFGTVRYGGQVDDTTFFRVYGKYANRDGTADIDGDSRPDDWDMAQGGFRMDGGDDSGGSWTLQGDVYDSGRLGRGSTLPTPVPFGCPRSR